VHKCNTVGGRNAPRLVRKSASECEKSEQATISVSSNMTKFAAPLGLHTSAYGSRPVLVALGRAWPSHACHWILMPYLTLRTRLWAGPALASYARHWILMPCASTLCMHQACEHVSIDLTKSSNPQNNTHISLISYNFYTGTLWLKKARHQTLAHNFAKY